MEKITKRVINIILCVAFLTLIICMGISKKEEKQIKSPTIEQKSGEVKEQSLIITIEENEQQNEVQNVKEYPKVDIVNTYRGKILLLLMLTMLFQLLPLDLTDFQ